MAVARRSAGVTGDDLAEERRAAIMAAAEELVAVHGFDALRLRDVSRRAGVSIGLIQYYFTTRDELLLETMRQASRHRAEQWTRLGNGPLGAGERLAALLDGSISDRHRCVVWLETCAASTRHPELRPDVEHTQNAWRAAMRAVVDDGVAAGEFVPTIPVEDVVVLIVGLIDGLMLATATEAGDDVVQGHRIRLLHEAARRLLPPPTRRRRAGGGPRGGR